MTTFKKPRVENSPKKSITARKNISAEKNIMLMKVWREECEDCDMMEIQIELQ